MTAFDNLAGERRWVAWRTELRRAGEDPTKVPYSTSGRRAKANDPETWVTRGAAEATAAQIVNGQLGGIGIQLGDLGGDTYLVGLDLDSCMQPDGAIAEWANLLLGTVDSYAEVSPSGTGIKLFFYVAAEDVRPFLDMIGVPEHQWGTKRSIGTEVLKHGPAVELYCAERYFTVTGNRCPESPEKLALVDAPRSNAWPSLSRRRAALLFLQAPTGGAAATEWAATSHAALLRFARARLGAALARPSNRWSRPCATIPKPPPGCVKRANRSASGSFGEFGKKRVPAWAREIIVKAGERHLAADAALAAMAAAGTPFYQRDRAIARVCRVPAKAADGEIVYTPAIVPVGIPMLGRAMGMAAQWGKFKANGAKVRRRISPKTSSSKLPRWPANGHFHHWPG